MEHETFAIGTKAQSVGDLAQGKGIPSSN